MELDSERQREILLRMFEDLTFPGKYLDELYALKQAITRARIPSRTTQHGPQEGGKG